MSTTDSRTSFEQKLCEQLHGLSELSELMTLRLLELEERLAVLEKSTPCSNDDMEDENKQLLSDSQRRFKHVQTLLKTKSLEKTSLEVVPETLISECPNDQLPNDENFDSQTEFLEVNREDIESNLEISNETDNLDSMGNASYQKTEYLDDPQSSLMSA